MVIWLVRHGESTWNALGLAQGHCDQARLTRRGEQQAWAVAAQLHSRPIGALYASDLRRAVATAAPLATVLGLPVTRDARLRERCLGVLEGTESAAIHPTVSGLRAHRVVDADARPPGGESLREFYRRVAEFADDLPALGDPALRKGKQMNQTTLHLPRRAEKPRAGGLTMIIDGGIPLWYFTDLVSSAAEYIDFVKFGWGTAVVSSDLRAKIKVLSTKDIGFYFGGTLFEKYVLQGRFDDFRRFCQLHSARHVEVSNGMIPMSNTEKASYIRKLADDFTVVSEVGFKDPVRSGQLPPETWVEYISEDLEAGASLVTLEARESGKSGICRPDGALRSELIEDVLASGISQESLLFEAPTTSLQTYFITRLGPDANLGNVPVHSVIALETLRLGLRADTLTAFE